MIEIESRELADIPVLHAYPVGQKDTPLPCAIFYHGFTSSSLVYSYFAVALAQAGLRVIMPDAPDHGSRFSGDAARALLGNSFCAIAHFFQFAAFVKFIDIASRSGRRNSQTLNDFLNGHKAQLCEHFQEDLMSLCFSHELFR